MCGTASDQGELPPLIRDYGLQGLDDTNSAGNREEKREERGGGRERETDRGTNEGKLENREGEG